MKKTLSLILISSLSIFMVSCSNSNSTSLSSVTNSTENSTSIIQSESLSSEMSSSSQISSANSTEETLDTNALVPNSIDSGPYISPDNINFTYKGTLDDLKSFYKDLGITGTETDTAPEGTGAAMSGNPYWQLDGIYNGNKITISADEVDGTMCNVNIDL